MIREHLCMQSQGKSNMTFAQETVSSLKFRECAECIGVLCFHTLICFPSLMILISSQGEQPTVVTVLVGNVPLHWRRIMQVFPTPESPAKQSTQLYMCKNNYNTVHKYCMYTCFQDRSAYLGAWRDGQAICWVAVNYTPWRLRAKWWRFTVTRTVTGAEPEGGRQK